ncbi:BppU family phage baseplate upper protein [Staphylococcus sp. GDY8P82P]|uniref:BppU family phage baseplate upper protein n=1 Tax=Staphylococcus sp. GDY8P82P TaxID=2804136 RepID=UPI001AEC0FA2|nr:BppU family phage baseplate upper protein [Staphylococcus sp. GDY8P82P]
MAIFKNKDIEANINERTVELGNINANFYTEDEQTASIRMFIKWNNHPVNLNKINMKPVLSLFMQDGSIFEGEKVEVVIPEKGIIQYKIPSNVIKHIGKVNAKLFLENENESIHVVNFNFTIVDSGTEEPVRKELSFNLVDEAIRRIVQVSAIELLGDDFENRLNENVVNHLDSNPELYKGPKGDKGDKGDIGPQGIKGDTGATGAKGDIGEQGIQGPKGDTGDKGDNGIDGQDGVIRFEDLAPEQKELFTKGQVILEHPIKGYPPRHDISYVTWIGVNEPQEAEVFDEWRQIPGFVYFTDFHTVNDWVKKDADILNVEKVLDDNEDAMLIETRGASRKSLLWDNIKTTKDLEIYFSGKKSSFASGQTISALLKYTNEELIFCGPYDKELRVTKVNLITGKSTVLYQTTHNVDLNKKFHLIARIDENRFKGKIWQDGMKEPKDWQINGNSDEVVIDSQNIGIYTFVYGKDIIYKFGVGTNGMRAPHREVY